MDSRSVSIPLLGIPYSLRHDIIEIRPVDTLCSLQELLWKEETHICPFKWKAKND